MSNQFLKDLSEALSQVTQKYYGKDFHFVAGRLDSPHLSYGVDLEISGKLMAPKAVRAPYIPSTAEEVPHKDHDIVTNHAGGSSFRYCRDCKVEVP